MELIILAGGLGTRLSQVVSDVPKPMAPIRNRPFLDYLMDWLSAYRVSRVIMSVGYKSDIITDHFGTSFNNIPIVYAYENEPLGTGGAILNALKYASANNVLVVNGDTYFPVDLDILSEFHTANGGVISIALKLMENFDRYGTVDLHETTISGFKEKQRLESGLINGGIYFLKKDFFNSKTYPLKFSFETEILEKETAGGDIKGLVFSEMFIDIGVPDDYQKACEEL
jgi:D-glycero-alpha-D-manno-heptose 1-phosphate guanylyltransferase